MSLLPSSSSVPSPGGAEVAATAAARTSLPRRCRIQCPPSLTFVFKAVLCRTATEQKQRTCYFSNSDGASTVPMSHAFSHPVKWSIFKWHHTVKEGIWIKSRNGACDGMSSTCATLESDFFLQVDHTIVRISARIILYIMLDHLGIRRAIYRRRMYSQNKSV
ncbi:uncharacterized protein [Triticum aestivum]|uniref:uncharacterized protein n=1 Tax=Triticum aestivum TaxID=4565 RepID=UPI001D005DA8|nr:uncharacterized protein LOC123046484 [Triticum aestivum]